ncbi:unnamed protein product [Danaus chrysippus]|uniref:(African queen) hypothetical protein n=1 Tax=Danaus chrysippus TaxID=151541 RepID=A0A8J2QG22_9NEOP|nr:unnamed protein product [Danaus chrysippus]
MGYASRAHLGVTIVGMTSLDDLKDEIAVDIKDVNGSTKYRDPKDFNLNHSAINSGQIMKSQDSSWNIYKKYKWSKKIQEMVHGSFFLGYCVMMFPMGMVCHRWGGKIPLQIAMSVNAFISFFTPWIIAWGSWKALCVCRILQGLSQAGLYPAIQSLLSNWVPISERGSLSSYVYTGSGVGTVLAFQVAGVLAFSRFGWPSTFWFTGITCFVAFVLITVFGSARPDDHKSISEAEKLFIIGKVSHRVQQNVKIPWKAIITSIHVWATFVAHVGSAIFFVFFFIQIPTYMNAILKLDIRSNGILSSLPYIAAIFACIAFGFLSDFLINKKGVSIKKARIISSSIGAYIPALCCLFVPYTTNTVLAVICFVTSSTAHAAMHSGWMVNYIDLAPNLAGTLMATGNTITNILIVFMPLVVSNIVTDVTDQHQWRIVMFLMTAIGIVTNTIFVTFMTTEVQPWNEPIVENANDPEDIKLEEKKVEKEAKL